MLWSTTPSLYGKTGARPARRPLTPSPRPSLCTGTLGQGSKPQAGWSDTHQAALWHSESTFIYKALYKHQLLPPHSPLRGRSVVISTVYRWGI